MNYIFYKYQGTGNDFIIIDNRQLTFDKNNANLVGNLCDRRFGIGADGLILLENHNTLDFKMVYYNSDGNESTMCGNGGRCIVAFAQFLGIIESKTTFMAIDGIHHAIIDSNIVKLGMQTVDSVKQYSDYIFLNTGSPHHVQMVTDLENLDVNTEGSKIRYSSLYGKEGSNVNFIHQITDDSFAIRTYERGVENETLSCGTGVTAAAIAMYDIGKTTSNKVELQTQGGLLSVYFDKTSAGYQNIWLIGPATFVFKGEISC